MFDLLQRLWIAVLAVALLGGCAALVEMDRTLYEAVPNHPVTGAPAANIVSEAEEVKNASQGHARIVGALGQAGLELDPPGA